MPGACARAAIAELTLFLAGRSDEKRLRVAVDAFFEHWGELLKRKSKQGTHEGPYGIAPYYFMYGHTYAAIAIEALLRNFSRQGTAIRAASAVLGTGAGAMAISALLRIFAG